MLHEQQSYTAGPLALAELDLERGHLGLAAGLAARRAAVLGAAAALAGRRRALVARLLLLLLLGLLDHIFYLLIIKFFKKIAKTPKCV